MRLVWDEKAPQRAMTAEEAEPRPLSRDASDDWDDRAL